MKYMCLKEFKEVNICIERKRFGYLMNFHTASASSGQNMYEENGEIREKNIMVGKSLNIKEGIIKKLKEFIPETFTENKIDWEKLIVVSGENIEFEDKCYILNWAGKSKYFKVLQSPTTVTIVPDRIESINFYATKNVLHELILKSSIFLTAEIEKHDDYYAANKNKIILILEKDIKLEPKNIITLDRLFDNNDQLKTNIVLQMKDAEIEFKVV